MNQKGLIELTARWLEGYEEARRHVTSDVLLSDFRKEAAENYNDSVLVPTGLGWMEKTPITQGEITMIHEGFVPLTKMVEKTQEPK